MSCTGRLMWRIAQTTACLLLFAGAGCSLLPLHSAPLSTTTLNEAGIIVRYDLSGLPTVRLRVGNGVLTAEIASTMIQRTSGLAWRDTLSRDQGMLFVNQQPQIVVYNSRNTLIPLSCAYLDQYGSIVEIHHMSPNDLTPVLSRTDQVKFVLEVNRGWFEEHQVAIGSQVMVVN